MKSKIYIAILFLSALFQLANAQTAGDGIVQGTVSSKTNGELLTGVNVQEISPDNRVVNATITDANGHFVIRFKSSADKLSFSYLGFVKESRPIGSSKVVNVGMTESGHTIQDITITAKKMYGEGGFKIPEREISTAVQTINAKAFEGLQVGSIDEALQGRVAGLDIVANSGDPGSGSSMRIRGSSTINSNADPLIVVNGVPYNISIDASFDFANANQEQYANMLSINPDDILEITVLKDAASTAIWGIRGANGVLMVTTKKGAMGPTKIQYTYRLTRATQPKGLNMLNGDDYTMLMKQAYFNQNQDESAADLDEYNYDPTYSEYENFNNNTDWVKAVSQTGYIHDHYVTVLGGGERAQFRVSGGYYDQVGTVIGQKMNRYSSRAYLDYSVSDRLKFITEFSYTNTDNLRNYGGNILNIAYRKMPNVSIYQQDANGVDTDIYYNISRFSSLGSAQRDLVNPVAQAMLATDNVKNYRIIPTFRLRYDLTGEKSKNLEYNMYVSFDINNDKVSSFLPWEVSNISASSSNVNRAGSIDKEELLIQTDNNLTWQPKFDNEDHTLMLYGSFQATMNNVTDQEITNYNLASGTSTDASQAGYLSSAFSSISTKRTMAFMARAHYAYKSKYIASFTMRREGSSVFGRNNRWGNFPGLSFKWIASDEEFLESTRSWLSMLAIRPSWGISGNAPSTAGNSYSRYVPYESYIDMPSTKPTSLRLADLRWEKTNSWNLGMDLGLLDDRFTFDLNAYHKRTSDLLFPNLTIPSTSGFTVQSYKNVGSMDNDGYEINFFTSRLIKKGAFTADFNLNISNNVNTVIQLDDKVLQQYNPKYNYGNGEYLSRLENGHSFGSIYGFKYEGVYKYDDYNYGENQEAPVARDKSGNILTDENGKALPMMFAYGTTSEYEFRGGDAKYKDINHDGSIDELDIVYLGNSNPKLNGGFGSTLRYKNLNCTLFFNFRYGNKIVNAARMYAENMYNDDNQSIAVNWRWRKDGDDTKIPRALYQKGYNWLGSDRFVEDGSFLRFKYLTFNYAVPSATLKPLGIDKVNVYLTFNNLYVFTKYTGVDPEVGYGSFGVSSDNAKTPRSKDFTLGLSIGL
jgi:TonB-linked SusC/RagA family outer membrane protein